MRVACQSATGAGFVSACARASHGHNRLIGQSRLCARAISVPSTCCNAARNFVRRVVVTAAAAAAVCVCHCFERPLQLVCPRARGASLISDSSPKRRALALAATQSKYTHTLVRRVVFLANSRASAVYFLASRGSLQLRAIATFECDDDDDDARKLARVNQTLMIYMHSLDLRRLVVVVVVAVASIRFVFV